MDLRLKGEQLWLLLGTTSSKIYPYDKGIRVQFKAAGVGKLGANERESEKASRRDSAGGCRDTGEEPVADAAQQLGRRTGCGNAPHVVGGALSTTRARATLTSARRAWMGCSAAKAPRRGLYRNANSEVQWSSTDRRGR